MRNGELRFGSAKTFLNSAFIILHWRTMGFVSDLKVLYHLAVKPVRGHDHASRMESFYAGQAGAYDDFRKRLLRGRQELWNLLPRPLDGIWVDMGGGTGSNLEYFGTQQPPGAQPAGDSRLAGLKSIYVVDLSPSLLDVARQRATAA